MAETIYEAAGGRQGFMNLARAWHARCLADPIVSHAFSHGYHPQHSERLAAYWAEALGGPSDYTNSMGDQSGVVRLHSGNGEHVEMDERAQTCFAQALDDARIPGDPRLRSTLKAYFRWATEAMAAHPRSAEDVPAGLRLARSGLRSCRPFDMSSMDRPVNVGLQLTAVMCARRIVLHVKHVRMPPMKTNV